MCIHVQEGERPARTLRGGKRIAVVGKGGVGKSTLTAAMARLSARSGSQVLAVDADEQCNLGSTLGFDPDTLRRMVPVSLTTEYVEEKTGARPGGKTGGMLRLNPDTSDIVDRLSIVGPDGVRLLVMGGVQRAAGGCLCPENALLAAAVAGMRRQYVDIVVMDTHAGAEHFGRALAQGFDNAIVMIEPTYHAIDVGLKAAQLAHELGITAVHLAVNHTRSTGGERHAVEDISRTRDFPFASVHNLPYDERLLGFAPSIGTLLTESDFAKAAWGLLARVVES